jgi:hypothetical protein
MKSMKQFYILMALAFSPVAAFADLVMGIMDGVYNDSYVAGFVCDRGSTDSLKFHVYVDGPAGSGQAIGSGLASNASEPAVDNHCGHPGEDGSHRFIYTFSEAQKQEHQGKPIYIHGIRGGLANRLIDGSGNYFVPAPSAVPPQTVDPEPINPEPVDPEPVDDTGLNFGANVSIDRIVLWENSEANPLYFRRSDDVLCYVPAGQSTLQSLILTLYSSGKLADIHCRAEEEELMLGMRPAHKLHRIIAK